jgi:ATP-dependent HslUV protease subunit HslV
VRHSSLTATEIAEEAVRIASEICIYTNDRITIEELDTVQAMDDISKESR